MSLPSAIQSLPWDSEFLGFPVARLVADNLSIANLSAAITAARATGIQLLYAVADPTNELAAQVLRQAGAWLADRKVTFVMPLPATVTSFPTAIAPTMAYTPQLESLAWQSGEFSRFRLDPRLAPTVFRQLYSLWLRNSLAGSIARQVLVWRNAAGQEQGLVTLGEKDGRAQIGLLAVDAAARGQQVGQQLIEAAVAQAADWGYAELQVVTQGNNEPACRFYEKCGFRLAHEEHIYHLWLP